MATKMARIYMILIGALLLAGCTEKWAKPGATAADFDGMKAACTSRGYAMFPPMMRQIQMSDAYTTPVVITCNNEAFVQKCSQNGGQYIPADTTTVDDNDDGRNQNVRSCFYQQGWNPVKK